MDSLYNKKNPEVPKLQALNGNVPRLLIPRGRGFRHHQSTSPFKSYSPENLTNTESPLVRYLRSNSPVAAGDAFNSPGTGKFQYSSSGSRSSGKRSSLSPLSAVENLEAVDEDVLVMDAVLVGSIAAGGRVSRPGSVLSSGGGESSSSSSGSSTSYKMEICRAWEDIGQCRFGSTCQFAHGKEELRPTRFPIRNKSELSKSYTNTGSGTYGPKSRFVQQIIAEAAAATTRTPSPMKPEPATESPTSIIKPEHTGKTLTSTTISEGTSKILSSPTSIIKPEHTVKTPTSEETSKMLSSTPTSIIKDESCSKPTTIISRGYWSPQDDGIVIALPVHTEKSPSTEDIDEHMQSVLYGPSKRRRLPVFTEICPD